MIKIWYIFIFLWFSVTVYGIFHDNFLVVEKSDICKFVSDNTL